MNTKLKSILKIDRNKSFDVLFQQAKQYILLGNEYFEEIKLFLAKLFLAIVFFNNSNFLVKCNINIFRNTKVIII